MNQILGYKYWNDWLCATRTKLCQTLDKMTLGIGIDEPRWNLSWAIVYFVILGWTVECNENHWNLKLDDHLKELVLASRVTFSLLRVPVCVRMICSECGMRNLTVYSKYNQGKGDFNEGKCTSYGYEHKKEAISCLLKICIKDEEDRRRQY